MRISSNLSVKKIK